MKRKVPTLKTVMTPFPYTIEMGERVSDALVRMNEHEVHYLPVTEQHTLKGVVSERDLTRLVEKKPDNAKLLVRDVYHRELYAVDIETPLAEVLNELAERQIGAAVVLRHGKLAGILTVTDACRHFAKFIEEFTDEAGPKDVA